MAMYQHNYTMKTARLLVFVLALTFSVKVEAELPQCSLYPIAISAQSLEGKAPGATIEVWNGVQPGNFGWLAWAGSPSEPTLVRSLSLPGDGPSYINPDDKHDHQLSPGDWVQGKPGVSNSKQIRAALDALKTVDILLPVWSATRGQGNKTDYKVSAFASVRILNYLLPSQNKITATFLGYVTCGVLNRPTLVNAGPDQTIVLPDVANLSGTIVDDGTVSVQWSSVAGPGAITFGTTQATNTTATFSLPGTYVVRFSAMDGEFTVSDDLVITVNRPNQAPIADDESIVTEEDLAVSVVLQGDDLDADPLSYAVDELPSYGTLSGTPPNLVYTPKADFHGNDSFTFKVNDGRLESEAATVLIVINPVNDAPVADNQSLNTGEDIFLPVVLSGGDVEGSALSYSVVTQPLHGTLTGTVTNLVYSPSTNYSGPDSFTFKANDGLLDSAAAEISMIVISSNDAPDVYAGPDQIISEPVSLVFLDGIVTDDNFLGYYSLTTHWSLLTGPTTFAFSDPTNRATAVLFGASGIYTFRLSANDGLIESSDEVEVIFNQAPSVSTGADQTNTLPEIIFVAGTVQDDGLPTTGALTLEWKQVSGPGTVVFDNPTNAMTSVTFSESGRYVLRLEANDSLVTRSDEVYIAVNSAPFVDAGPDQVITNLVSQLNGTAVDDGMPDASLFQVSWTKLTGPGLVEFSTNSAITDATFSEPGIYVLQLTGNDSIAQSSDEVTISINQAPVVQAGVAQTVDFPHGVSLTGTVSDDSLPGGQIQLEWSQVSGPGTATFSASDALATGVTFTEAGQYMLRLTADDSLLKTSADVLIAVNAAPIANNQSVTMSEDTAVTITLTAVDQENSVLAFTVVSGPEHGALAVHPTLENAYIYTADGEYYGADSFAFSVSDGRVSSAPATVTIAVNPVNDPPVVDAGPDFEALDTVSSVLRGAAYDDGTPSGATLEYHWEQVSGPGTASLQYAREAVTAVQFETPGSYVFKLTVSDSELAVSDLIAVTVIRGNRAPTTSAGTSHLIVLPEVASVTGYFLDDGLPARGSLTWGWSKVSGPGTATFAAASATNTTVEFSQAGVYVLRFTVDDSQLTSSSDITVQVLSPEMNQAPYVNAGLDKVVGLTDSPTLCGTVTNDALPRHATITVQWSVVSGPGEVSFVEPANTRSKATFDTLGTYVLRLTASDSLLSAFDEVAITVYPYNHPPEVDAGADQTITIPQGSLVTGTESINASTYLSSSLLSVDSWNPKIGQPGISGQAKGSGNIWVTRNGLDVDSGNVYAAGAFTNAGGILAKSLAKWDGNNWHGFYDPRTLGQATTNHGGGTSGSVIGWDLYDCTGAEFCTEIFYCVAGRGSEAFTAGWLMELGNSDGYVDMSARWSGTGWESWVFKQGGNHVRVIKTTPHLVYLGGYFSFQPTNASSSTFTNLPWSYAIATWDGTNWGTLGSGIVDVRDYPQSNFPARNIYNAYITSMAVRSSNEVYVAGEFNMQTRLGLANNVAMWNGQEWLPLGTGISDNGSGLHCTALALAPNGDLYLGGSYTNAGGVSVRNLARWDGEEWHSVGDGVKNGVLGDIEAMAFYGGNLYVGGAFAEAGGVTVNRVARWNGSFWSPLGTGSANGISGGDIFAMDVDEGGVYVGGTFNAAGGKSASRIAKWEFATPPSRGVQLAGRVSDDGLPADSILAAHWTKISGPGEVAFADAESPTTSATFDQVGSYVLRLTADDSDLTALDEVTVMVRGNEAPSVEAEVNTPAIGVNETVTLTGTITDDGSPEGAPLASQWTLAAGSGTVTFGNASSLETTARFSAAGTYLLRLTANDSQFSAYKELLVTVAAQNNPPGISLGSAQTVGLGDVAYLNAVVSDDGRPADGALTFSWTQLNGPTQVRFADAGSKVTTARFSALGTYTLRFTANDSQLSAFADLTVTVVTNKAPVVTMGPTQIIYDYWTVLQGDVTDDGNPLSGSLNLFWTQLTGPAACTLLNSNSPVTGVTFPTPGSYKFRLSASDTQLSAFGEITVHFQNRHIMSAGPDRAITLPQTNVTLHGWASFYSNEVSSAGVAANWTKVSGPGTVSFGTNFATNAFPLVVTAGFSTTGIYVLRLETKHSQAGVLTDTVTVSVAPAGNLPPSTDAGSPITLQLPNNTAVLSGSASDDGLPNSILNIRWQQIRGPGKSVLSNTNTLSPTATFPAAGIYILRLSATDGALTNGSDLAITVRVPENQAPVLNAGPDLTITLPEVASLNGSWSDDGNPLGINKISDWSKKSGPGHVLFTPRSTTNTQPVATAQFDLPGTYVLRLTATEFLSGSDEIVVTVLAPSDPIPTNFPPTVNAGADIVGVTGRDIHLGASATDDGLPNGSLQTRWFQLSAPTNTARTYFGDATQASTTVRFYIPGIYVLRFVANDSQLAAFDDLVITVSAPTNSSPAVYAGPDFEVTRPDAANLQGAIFDDGLPATNLLSSLWSKLSGPGNLTFVAGSSPTNAKASVTFSVAGTYVLRLTGSDTQFTASDEVTVLVHEGINVGPAVNAGPDFLANTTSLWPLSRGVDDDGLPNGFLQSTWSEVAGTGSVQFRTINGTYFASFATVGTYNLRLTATDGAVTNSDEVTVTVYDAPNAPEVAITSPVDSQEITAPTEIIGTANSLLLASYELQYRSVQPQGTEDNWVTFRTNNVGVENGLLGVIDPTLMLNGLYQLRLRATDQLGRVASTELVVVLDRNLKIGNFTVSFNDLTVPMAGIPLQITRTYDSRNKETGDFGVGWSMDIKNVRLQKNRRLDTDWEETATAGAFPIYSVQQTKSHKVTITFPSGKVYKFTPVASPSVQFAIPIQYGRINYVPSADTRGTLKSTLVDDRIAWVGSKPGEQSIYDLNAIEGASLDFEYNPDLFDFTTPDNFKYTISETNGLRSMTDPNGNTITITTNGIIHSGGKSVLFQRDSFGRITNLVDAAGNSMTYQYSTNGDLVTFKDRIGQTNGFSYDNRHNLISLTDARGISPVRNDFDDDGRLIRHTDAFDREVNYTHDTTNRQEVIGDRLSNLTIHEYDLRGNVIRTIAADGAVTQSTYDANDNLLTQVDALGRTNTFTYDTLDNRTSVSDPLDNTTRLTHNSLRRVTSIIDPLGNIITNTFDAKGNLLTVRDSLGNVTKFGYNSRGLPTSITNAANQVTRYAYDSAGNVTNEVDATGHTTSYFRDTHGNLLQQTTTRVTSGGIETLTIAFQYDKLNRLTNSVAPDGSSAQTIYNLIGKSAVSIDQAGRQSSRIYDELGRLTHLIHPDGSSSRRAYDEEGRVIASTNALGQVTRNEYDSVGRLFRTILTDGSSTTNYFDVAGQTVASSDQLGHFTFYGYDLAGRTVAITNAIGEVTRSFYDAAGNLTNTVDSLNRSTQFIYDALNRRVQAIFPDNSTQTTTYDLLGRRIAETDQAGKTTYFGFDFLGRMTTVTNALGYVTSYAYNELGQQISQTDANLHTTSFEYDSLGRRVKRILPGGQIESYHYDILGNLTNKTDFNGDSTTYSYDMMNRLLQRTPSPSQIVLGSRPVSYGYNVLGLRTNMIDATGETTYTYDALNRQIAKTMPLGTLNYGYNENGSLTNIHSSTLNGTQVRYGYDDLNRLISVNDANVGVTTYTYDGAGNTRNITYPNNITTTYEYNRLNRLTNMFAGTLVTAVAQYRYTVGAGGNRLTAAETVNVGSGTSSIYRSYSYDDLYRLTGESIGLGAASASSLNYIYDPVGNRLSRGSTMVSLPGAAYAYDSNDRLTSDNYDANGNTKLALLRDPVSAGQHQVSDSYDFENHLISRQINGTNITLVYDGDGNRFSKTVNGVTTYYLVDDLNPTGYAQVLEELSPETSGLVPTVIYTYGHSLISQDRINGAQWETSFYGYDGHNNVRYLTDGIGNVTDTYDYDAFGNLIARTGSTLNNRLFTGEQFDFDLNLYYLRARYHNPDTGRFWSMDTFEGFGSDPTSLHKYTYCGNDAVNLLDPSGNTSIPELSITTGMFAVARGIFGATIGGMTGSLAAGYDSILNGRVSNQELATAMTSGFREGAIAGGVLGFASGFGSVGSFGASAIGMIYSGQAFLASLQAYADGNHQSAGFRAGLGIFGSVTSSVGLAGALTRQVSGFQLESTRYGVRNAVWQLGYKERGLLVENAWGGNLPPGFETYDSWFPSIKTAVSIKTMDLDLPSFNTASGVRSTLMRYINNVIDFDTGTKGRFTLEASQIQTRVLKVAIPRMPSRQQMLGIQEAVDYGNINNVEVKLSVY